MNFNERLKWAREEAGFTQKQLVDLLPKKPDGKAMMSQANLAKMEKNDKTVGSNYSYFIAIACGISPNWLINESGDPKGITVNYKGDEPEYEVLTLMQAMDEKTKKRAVRLLSTLTDPNE
jgi:transcriptional regulator with XRE-family HTH domain